MRIAVDCRMLGMSGIGVFLENIVTHLLSDFSENVYVLIGKEEKLRRFREYPNCRIIDVDINIFSFKELFQFPVKDINACDVFYSPNFNIPGFIKIPVYSTIHDVVFLDVDGLTGRIGKYIRKWMLWRAIFLSQKIFTVSEFSKSRILYHFPTDKKIEIIHNAVSDNLKKQSARYPVSIKEKYIIYVGNIKPHKGLGTLLDAFKLLREKGIKEKLYIVGNAANFRTPDTKVVELMKSLSEEVVFTGYVSDDDLFNLIRNASVLVQPSVYEGFGIPPLEALYLGTSVLVSDIPVFKELYSSLNVKYFQTGDMEDLANQLLSLLSSTPCTDCREKVLALYNYEKSAKILLENILK